MDDEQQSSAPKQVLVTMPADLVAAVDRFAQRRVSSRAQVVREATADFLRREGFLEAAPAEAAV